MLLRYWKETFDLENLYNKFIKLAEKIKELESVSLIATPDEYLPFWMGWKLIQRYCLKLKTKLINQQTT